MKRSIIRYSVTTAIGLLIAYAVMQAEGFFELIGGPIDELMMILCDASFVPGIMILMLGLLVWIASTGFFDSLGYAARTALHIIFPMGIKERKSYYDYRAEKAEKRKGKMSICFMLVVGSGFIIASIAFLITWTLLQNG